MAHYAFINHKNIVTQVVVGRDEDDLVEGVTDWEIYYGEQMGQTCKRTSYNTVGGQHTEGGKSFRYNYAGIGYTFNPDKGTDGAFIPPKPYESWVLNEETCLWEAPIPKPDGDYTWDEQTGDWVEVEAV